MTRHYPAGQLPVRASVRARRLPGDAERLCAAGRRAVYGAADQAGLDVGLHGGGDHHADHSHAGQGKGAH